MNISEWASNNAILLIGHGLTIVSILVGVGIVVWQLGRQQQNLLKLQKGNAREKLKLQIYERLIEKIRNVTQKSQKAISYVDMVPVAIENYQGMMQEGLSPFPVNERAPVYSELNNEASQAVFEIFEEFGAWSIAFPTFEVFKVALSSAGYDVREAFLSLHYALVRTLPMEPPDNAPLDAPELILQNPLTGEQISELRRLVDSYREAIYDVISYATDLGIEAQNTLLSELFEDSQVELRRPLDSTHKVISTSPEEAQRLIQYFKKETAWGKEKERAEKHVVTES